MDWRAVALAVLLACTGCTALVGDDPGRETATVTPAAVPEQAGEGSAPDGVAAGNVRTALLVGGHKRALRNTSYMLVIERSRFAEGDRRYRRTVVAAVDGDTYRVRVSNRSPSGTENRTVVSIGDGDRTPVFERADGGPFRRANRSGVAVPTGATEIERALDAVDIATADTRRIGDHARLLTGTEPRNQTALAGPDERLVGVDLSGELRRNGLFRALDWEFTVERDGRTITTVSELDLRRVGWTTVNTTPPVGDRTADSR
jgi:hypothetical protein